MNNKKIYSRECAQLALDYLNIDKSVYIIVLTSVTVGYEVTHKLGGSFAVRRGIRWNSSSEIKGMNG